MKTTKYISDVIEAIEFSGKTVWVNYQEDTILNACDSRAKARAYLAENECQVAKLGDLIDDKNDLVVVNEEVEPYAGPARMEMTVFETMNDVAEMRAEIWGALVKNEDGTDEIIQVYYSRDAAEAEYPDQAVLLNDDTTIEVYSQAPLAPVDLDDKEELKEKGYREVNGETVFVGKDSPVISEHSTVEKPCKRVWAIAEELRAANPEVTRKEVIEACMKAGIAKNTASTQHHAWKKALKAQTSN